MILEPTQSIKASEAKSLALLAAGTNLVYGFASVKPSAVSSSSSSSQDSSFNLLIYEPRIYIRPLERDRPEHQSDRVLCLTEEEKTQLQKRPSRLGGPDIRKPLLDDMKSVAQRFLPSKKHGGGLNFMGKMLAEADDFWPLPLESHEVQEILSAVIAFRELTAWYAHRPNSAPQGEGWVILEMLQTLAEEIPDKSAMLKEFPCLLRHLLWCLDLLLQDPSLPSLPASETASQTASWRSFEELQRNLRKMRNCIDENEVFAEVADAKIDAEGKAPESEEIRKVPKVPKGETEKVQQIPASKAPTEKKKKEVPKKIPMAAENQKTTKMPNRENDKTPRNEKTAKGSRELQKDSKDKNKEKEAREARKEAREARKEAKMIAEYLENYQRHLRYLDRRAQVKEIKDRRRKEILEEKKRKREQEAAEAPDEATRRRRLLFGLAM
eukprot:s96_g32.t1